MADSNEFVSIDVEKIHLGGKVRFLSLSLPLSLFLHCLKFNLCFFFFSGFLVLCFAMLCYAVLCCAVLHLNEFVIRGNLLEMKWELIFVNVSSVFFFLFSFFSISIYRKIWFWGIAGLEMLHSKSGKSLFTRFVFVTIMVILIDSNHFYDLNAPNFAISQTHSSGEAVVAVSFL